MTFMTHFTHALTRTPSTHMAEGLTTQDLGSPDVSRAMQQYAHYLDTLRACGLQITILPTDDAYPDGHFVEDAAIVYRDLVVITQPGAPSRRGEPAAVERALRELCPKKQFACIRGEGRLDGGDVLVCAHQQVLIGLAERTNRTGAEQLRAALQSYDANVKVDFVEFSGVLHLKSGITELAPGVLLHDPQMHTAQRFDFAEIVTLPPEEGYAADVLPINDAVVIPAGFPTVQALAEKHCGRVFALEMSEFRKMDGGLTCLSVLYTPDAG